MFVRTQPKVLKPSIAGSKKLGYGGLKRFWLVGLRSFAMVLNTPHPTSSPFGLLRNVYYKIPLCRGVLLGMMFVTGIVAKR